MGKVDQFWNSVSWATTELIWFYQLKCLQTWSAPSVIAILFSVVPQWFFPSWRKQIFQFGLEDLVEPDCDCTRLSLGFSLCRCWSCFLLFWAWAWRWFVPMEAHVRTETHAARTPWVDTAAARYHMWVYPGGVQVTGRLIEGKKTELIQSLIITNIVCHDSTGWMLFRPSPLLLRGDALWPRTQQMCQ